MLQGLAFSIPASRDRPAMVKYKNGSGRVRRRRHLAKLGKSFRVEAVAFSQSQTAASKTGNSARWPLPESWLTVDKPQPVKAHHADQSSQHPASRKANGMCFDGISRGGCWFEPTKFTDKFPVSLCAMINQRNRTSSQP